MKSLTFGNFQVGIVDDPSIEDKGGFEFASGMDIFSELGVLKAANAMQAMELDTGVTLTALPTHMVRPKDQFGTDAWIAVGDKLLQRHLENDATAFMTHGTGVIDGLEELKNYLVYTNANKLGRINVSGASQNDNYATLSDSTSDIRAMVYQGGSLKIGNRSYVDSLSEAFTLTTQVLKLPYYAEAIALVYFLNDVFIGGGMQYNPSDNIKLNDATVYRWNGITLSTGSALPGEIYPSEKFITRALVVANGSLFALPDEEYAIYGFDGIRFSRIRKLNNQSLTTLRPNSQSVCEYKDGFLFSGNTDTAPGVFRFENGAICQHFVPAGITPGSAVNIKAGFVRLGYDNKLYIGYKNVTAGTYHIDYESSDKQNNAIIKTLWHRLKTDKLKRWGGVKLNLKPLAASTSVAVAYRTSRDAAFTDSGYTITSANQDKPVVFAARPRSREIQYKFTFTTNDSDTPELLSYDPLFEALNTIR